MSFRFFHYKETNMIIFPKISNILSKGLSRILLEDKMVFFILKGFKTFRDSGSFLNPLSANPTKWLNTLKKFVGKSGQIV